MVQFLDIILKGKLLNIQMKQLILLNLLMNKIKIKKQIKANKISRNKINSMQLQNYKIQYLTYFPIIISQCVKYIQIYLNLTCMIQIKINKTIYIMLTQDPFCLQIKYSFN